MLRADEEMSSEDEEAPDGVPFADGRGLKAKAKTAKVPARLIDDEAEEASKSEEEEGSEDDEEEEEEEEDAGLRALARQVSGGKRAAAAAVWGSENSSDEELESEEEEEEEEDSEEEEEGSEEEESSEEEPQPMPSAKPAAGKGGDKKRPAAAALPAKTPQPAKKARADGAAAKAPATAPPKVGGGAAPANQSEYIASLKAFVQANGPQKLANLGRRVSLWAIGALRHAQLMAAGGVRWGGSCDAAAPPCDDTTAYHNCHHLHVCSKVKRPESMPKHLKLKQLLQQHTSVFKYDATTDVVSV